MKRLVVSACIAMAAGLAAHPANASGRLPVHAWVSPNPVSYGDYATLHAKTTRGAICTASVVYSTGRAPVSFGGGAERAGAKGNVSWSWHMESEGSYGSAEVDCRKGGAGGSASATFNIG